jgi:hypothetical protein
LLISHSPPGFVFPPDHYSHEWKCVSKVLFDTWVIATGSCSFKYLAIYSSFGQ